MPRVDGDVGLPFKFLQNLYFRKGGGEKAIEKDRKAIA